MTTTALSGGELHERRLIQAAIYDPRVSPPTMRITEQPQAVLGPDEIRVDVRAVPMSNYWLSLETVPFVPGWVFAGYVCETGAEVTRLQLGERVVAVHRTGGLAESAVAPRLAVRRLPAGLSFQDAVCLFAATKVSLVVDDLLGRLAPTDEPPVIAVLHDGTHFASVAAGLLRDAGARTIGISGSPSTIGHQLAIRFEEAIDHDHETIEHGLRRLTDGRGVHGLIDHLGQIPTGTAAAVLRPGGCFVRCARFRPASASDAAAEDDVAEGGGALGALGVAVVDFAGIGAAAQRFAEIRARVDEVATAIMAGSIVLPTTTVPFAEVACLPELVASRRVAGSIVVTR